MDHRARHLDVQQDAVFKGPSGGGSRSRAEAIENHNAAEGILGRVGVGASLRTITEAIERHLADMDRSRRERIREVVLRLQNERLIAPTGSIQARVRKKKRRRERQEHIDPRTTDTTDMGLTRKSKEIRKGIRLVLPDMPPDATANQILTECRKRGHAIGNASSFTNYHVPAVKKELRMETTPRAEETRDPEAQPPRKQPGVSEPQGERTPAESEAGAEHGTSTVDPPPAPPAEEKINTPVTTSQGVQSSHRPDESGREIETPIGERCICGPTETRGDCPKCGIITAVRAREIMLGQPVERVLPVRRSIEIDLEGLIRADVRFNVDEVAKWGEDRIRLFFDSLAGMTLATLAQNGGRP